MTVHDYCPKLKSLADVPFPSFLQTRSALVLEEAQKKTDAKNAAATALWSSGNNVMPNGGGGPPLNGGGQGTSDPRPPAPPHGHVFNHGQAQVFKNGGRGGFNNTRGRGRGERGRGRTDPWMFNPWTGLPTRAQFQQQPPPAPWQPCPWRAPGVLGPRPGMPQAYTAYGTFQQYQGHPSAAPSPAQHQPPQHVDPALLTVLSNMHLPGNQEWHMDTGASSYMASDYASLALSSMPH
nr:uncharacterized protein LOC127339579 [Lolium perenne]